MSDNLVDMIKRLSELKVIKESLETKLKNVNKEIRSLSEKRIPEYMDENEVDKLSIDGIGTCFLQTKVYAHVKKDDQSAFYVWLRENGNSDLIKETVHPSTLNAFAKEQLCSGNALPDTLSARLYQTAILRSK